MRAPIPGPYADQQMIREMALRRFLGQQAMMPQTAAPRTAAPATGNMQVMPYRIPSRFGAPAAIPQPMDRPPTMVRPEPVGFVMPAPRVAMPQMTLPLPLPQRPDVPRGIPSTPSSTRPARPVPAPVMPGMRFLRR